MAGKCGLKWQSQHCDKKATDYNSFSTRFLSCLLFTYSQIVVLVIIHKKEGLGLSVGFTLKIKL